MTNSANPNELYEKASRENKDSIDFWGDVPASFKNAVDMAISNFSPNNLKGTEKLETLKSILRTYHQNLGLLTDKVGEHIERLDRGSILMGQQPVVFGGPGFIGNKIGCLIHLYTQFEAKDFPLTPVFFVGDYDGLQKELSRQYFPNPISQNAHIIDSGGYLPEESDIAAHAAELPPLSWLRENLIKLEDNLSGFKTYVKGDKIKLVNERWAHIKSLLMTSFTDSTTLSEWGTKIWGHLTNLIADYGVVFLPTSHPEIRQLIATEYHRFLSQMSTYTSKFQDAMDRIEAYGYEPSLPHRHLNYSPFTLECSDDKNRISTTIREDDSRLFAEGECPSCGTIQSYEVTNPEDLQEIAELIGPRVDTSQAVFQEIMNIRIRISGPGEIAYYAQAAPGVGAIGFDLPIFVKYKRSFYNATWIEKVGKELADRDQGSLHQGTLFHLLRTRMDADKEENKEELIDAENAMEEFIGEQYDKLLQYKDSNDVQKYLGWQYGRFTPEKFGQEVSWVWFDMAIQTGIEDYIATYSRAYSSLSPLGGYYYINTLL